MSLPTRTIAAVAVAAAALAWWRRPVRQPEMSGTWEPAVPQASRR